MTIIDRIILGFQKKESRRKVDLDIERILELLGGDVPSKKEAESESDSDVSPAAVRKLMDEEHERKKRSESSWNKAFEEAVYPYLLDGDDYKPEVFFKTLLGGLIKKLGKDGATRYIDDLCSYTLKNLDIHIRQAHGTGSVVIKEPIGIMYVGSDENASVLREPDTEFLGTVVNRDPGDPYKYEIKVSGPELTEKVYRIDVSGSLLELGKNHKYRMETTSVVSGKGSQIRVKINGAERHGSMMRILSSQVPHVLTNALRDFMQTEYKEDIGKIERTIKDLEDKIGKLDREIESTEDEAKVEKLEKERHELLGRLEELSKVGIPSAEKFVREERHTSPFQQKQLKYKNPHDYWYDYHSQGAQDIAVEYSEDDAEKTKRDLGHALDEMHGDYKGIPMKDLAGMLMDSIYEVPDPTTESGWKSKLIRKVNKYLEDKKLEGIQFDHNDPGRLLKKVQETLLKDERFKNLRNNLVRTKMRQVMKKASTEDEKAGIEELKRTVSQVWGEIEKGKFEHLAAEYAMLEALKKSKHISNQVYRNYVEDETVSRYRRYLADGALEKAFDVIVGIGHGVGMIDDMVTRMKKLFLTDVWQLEDNEADRKVKLFNDYIRRFPEREDYKCSRERDRVYEDIHRLVAEGVGIKTDDLGKEEKPGKGRRQRKPKIDIEKVVEDKPIEKVIRERDPDLIKELEALF